jgi:ubiquinone/menaquinone biosynthesis C-methylase UbiE
MTKYRNEEHDTEMSPFDPEKIERLLSPERRLRMDPDLFLDVLEIKPGMVIADVGAGPGFFALPLAIKVGKSGTVYALDVEPTMLERLRERAADAGVENIETLVAEEDRLPLPAAAVDLALVFLVLHECSNRVGLLREVARILRPDGLVVVAEWRKDVESKGPPAAERLSPEEIAADLRAAGFGRIELLELPANLQGAKARR